MPQPVYVADAFTDTPFAGNPAAVVPLDGPAVERGIELDFPSRPPKPRPAPRELLDGLGAEPMLTGIADEDWFCEFADERTIRGLAPDFRLLKQLQVRGVVVTAKAEKPPFDF